MLTLELLIVQANITPAPPTGKAEVNEQCKCCSVNSVCSVQLNSYVYYPCRREGSDSLYECKRKVALQEEWRQVVKIATKPQRTTTTTLSRVQRLRRREKGRQAYCQ